MQAPAPPHPSPLPTPRARTTLPRYFFTSSGYSRTASDMEQNITPAFFSSPLNVVAMDTESNTASTATLASRFCSLSGMPSLSKVRSSSGSTSSREAFWGLSLGSE